MSAASVLAGHGLRPVLVDEGADVGGQIWRKPSAHFAPDHRAVLGAGAAAAHAAFAAIAGRLEHRPRTLAWNVFGGEVFLAEGSRISALGYDALLLATGATDRLMPIPGWTMPGVFTLGGAQTLLKDQGATIGRRVVFAGASPLLYLAALQYRAAGVTVAAVLDTTPLAAKRAALPALARTAPRLLARGLAMMARLRLAGVPVHHGVEELAVEGGDWAEAVRFRAAGAAHRIGCDAVALGFGLRPETQLADLAGVSLRFDPALRQWFPETDGDGRCGAGLYAAGDGALTGGAEAAEASGRLAAWAILRDLGHTVPETECAALRGTVARHSAFQRGLARAFAWPAPWAPRLAPDTMLCRCEGVTIGALREAVGAPLGPREINRAKAITRCGMGRCQGRFCGAAAAEVIASTLGLDAEAAGRLRGQAPVKPIPLDAALAEESAA
jgi:NADPH-dependent 2,4-dienoyl-CoA reductase/sulfur reductase-like enzyme